MTIYYTSQFGNNGNGLSLANAKTTIAAGNALCSAGDTLLVDYGVYAEALRDIIATNVTIKAITARTVTMRPSGGVNVIKLNHNNITIDGIDADAVNCFGSPYDGYNGGNGVYFATIKNGIARNGHGIVSSSSGILGDFHNGLIKNMEVYGNGTPPTNQDHGIYGRGADTVIEDCWMHDNYAYGLQLYPDAARNIVRRCRVNSNTIRGAAIYGHDCRCYNNLFYDNAWGLAIQGDNNLVANCVVYNSGYGSSGEGQQAILVGSGGGNIIRNNILWQNLVNSVVFSGGSGVQDHNLLTNPIFVSAGTGDFRLQASSPAINAGVDMSAYFTDDFNGFLRSGAWEIGAFDFDSIPSAISDINATGAMLFTVLARLNSNSLNASGLVVFGSVANINVKEMTATGNI